MDEMLSSLSESPCPSEARGKRIGVIPYLDGMDNLRYQWLRHCWLGGRSKHHWLHCCWLVPLFENVHTEYRTSPASYLYFKKAARKTAALKVVLVVQLAYHMVCAIYRLYVYACQRKRCRNRTASKHKKVRKDCRFHPKSLHESSKRTFLAQMAPEHAETTYWGLASSVRIPGLLPFFHVGFLKAASIRDPNGFPAALPLSHGCKQRKMHH